MALSDSGRIREHWTYGRGFTSTDPERQREVVVVRNSAIETTPPQRPAFRSRRLDWLRVQPDREIGNFEGSSSRRSR